MKPAPFYVTEEAEKMLRHMFASTPEGMEPALGWAPSLESWSKEGHYLGKYDGPMVVFGHWKTNERPRDSFFEVCQRPVSIIPSTLGHIEGKTIDLVQIELHGGAKPHSAYVFKVG